MIRFHDNVRRFLDDVCAEIRSREAHLPIRQELESHLESLAEERELSGCSREEALAWAIAQMGDPRLIGKDLHRIHRPKPEWGLITIILAFAAFGLMVIYALDRSKSSNPGVYPDAMLFLMPKLAAVGLGLAIMVGLYFFSYRKLQSMNWIIYGILVAGLLLVSTFSGGSVNGSLRYLSLGSFNIDWMGIAPFLFVLTAAGCLPEWYAKRKRFVIHNLAFLTPVVGLLVLCKSTPNLVLLIVGYMAVLGSVTKRWKTTLALGIGSLVGFSGIRLATRPWEMDRWHGYLSPEQDPHGSGYVYRKIAETIQSAGWLGQGVDSPLPQFPDIHSGLIFTYSLYSFGWLVGIGFAVGVLYMLSRLWHSFKQVRDPFGKHLVLGLASIIAFQLVYNLLMAIGLFPYLDVPLPFVSYGLYHVLYEMAAAGIILGIYRRKDMGSSSFRAT
ncbi:cell division protein FtsW, lipid II flippase [Paenibacillus sp. UNCCL117]|uniref:FtsW/RodA/SpoVE family cell cycle protein n=1 Tax=unclassified Paenibacillus TaxID=185978 RepID=UPI0008839AD3|nr:MULTISPECIES: FtsW/RodA/SpoVE family cell cycle protein [unclassified Paenibacillus]SDE09024.1 cell division protein FtsW, lipid II flippase [Paenibacillus sp. cl123]SFW58818.1 cell division protein FtsW, lipid II flippase [Paenibacillus sp. UNCCL117]